jgi:hypothetical protein
MSEAYVQKAFTNLITNALGIRRALRFKVRRRLNPINLRPGPALDALALEYFQCRLSAAHGYVEYGSGGSTLLAAAQGLPFVSIESDAAFADAVRRSIMALTDSQEIARRVRHINIGMTHEWGEPVFTGPSKRRYQLWRRYCWAPWVEPPVGEPDLVFVDGRFRVACTVATLLALGSDREYEILVDDYSDRPHYRVLAEIAQIRQIVDRMAILTYRHGTSAQDLIQILRQYETDWR